MAATGTPSRVSVAVACRVLGFSKQAYYQWLADPVSDRDWDDAHLVNAARDVWDEDPCQGYRLIADELREDGIAASERRVWRLCSQEGTFSLAHRRKGRGNRRRHGMTMWRAGCSGMGTSGSEGGQQKPTRSNAGRALLADPTRSIERMKASCICARSKTSSPAGSWGTRSATGCAPRWP